MVFTFLLSYSYSFGVFTDITRPYGIIVFLSIIYGILFLCCLVMWIRVYYKDIIDRGDKEWWEIIGYFFLFFIIGLPISTAFLTVVISLGAYVDWALDFKNDPVNEIAAYGLYWCLSYLRIGISSLFFVTYVN
mmetsp:Transcript_10752/g.961  ORF Transcript_10752/g.961 Transcript_10752/m.961 type:complete len:133 (+) Transcript_10752:123-521(+)